MIVICDGVSDPTYMYIVVYNVVVSDALWHALCAQIECNKQKRDGLCMFVKSFIAKS